MSEILKFPSTIGDILESEGVKAAYKALDSLDDRYKKTKMLCLADVAESVLHIYEQKHSNDSRVRNCIKGVRDYCNNKISEEELNKLRERTAFVASNAAVFAVYEVFASADIAVCAACAAVHAAVCASVCASWANINSQWVKNEEILSRYL